MDVIAYMSYSNEGVLLSRVGVEGQHYTLENGVITPTEKAKSSGYALSPGGFTTSIPVFDKLPFTWGGVGDKYFPKQVEIRDKTVAEGTLGPKYTVPSGVSDLFDKNSAGYLQTMKEDRHQGGSRQRDHRPGLRRIRQLLEEHPGRRNARAAQQISLIPITESYIQSVRSPSMGDGRTSWCSGAAPKTWSTAPNLATGPGTL
jgi:hypothetical protein